MNKRVCNPEAPFQRIADAARLTGLPVGYLRDGVKMGYVPHVLSGRTILINVPALLRKLDAIDAGLADDKDTAR